MVNFLSRNYLFFLPSFIPIPFGCRRARDRATACMQRPSPFANGRETERGVTGESSIRSGPVRSGLLLPFRVFGRRSAPALGWPDLARRAGAGRACAPALHQHAVSRSPVAPERLVRARPAPSIVPLAAITYRLRVHACMIVHSRASACYTHSRF